MKAYGGTQNLPLFVKSNTTIWSANGINLTSGDKEVKSRGIQVNDDVEDFLFDYFKQVIFENGDYKFIKQEQYSGENGEINFIDDSSDLLHLPYMVRIQNNNTGNGALFEGDDRSALLGNRPVVGGFAKPTGDLRYGDDSLSGSELTNRDEVINIYFTMRGHRASEPTALESADIVYSIMSPTRGFFNSGTNFLTLDTIGLNKSDFRLATHTSGGTIFDYTDDVQGDFLNYVEDIEQFTHTEKQIVKITIDPNKATLEVRVNFGMPKIHYFYGRGLGTDPYGNFNSDSIGKTRGPEFKGIDFSKVSMGVSLDDGNIFNGADLSHYFCCYNMLVIEGYQEGENDLNIMEWLAADASVNNDGVSGDALVAPRIVAKRLNKPVGFA
jgi:hypothetical protein